MIKGIGSRGTADSCKEEGGELWDESGRERETVGGRRRMEDGKDARRFQQLVQHASTPGRYCVVVQRLLGINGQSVASSRCSGPVAVRQ